MGASCTSDNKKKQKTIDKKKTQAIPNLPDKNSVKEEDNKSKLSNEPKREQQIIDKPMKRINLKDSFYSQFENQYVRTHSKENKKIEDIYQTLNLISTEEKVNNYKVKHQKIGLLRNMLKCEKDSSVLNKVIREANIQKGLDHPSILKIFEIFDGSEEYVVISEINDGRKLFDEINDIGPFQEKIAANLIYQLLNVVNYLHKNKRLIHSRINPGTIVVNTYDDDNEYYDIKLINYHDCVSFQTKNKPKTKELFDNYKTDCFSYDSQNNNLNNQDIFNYFGDSFIDRFFVAPETIKDDNYDEQSDIYSIGILAYYIITGKIPYINYSNDPKDYILNNKTSNEFIDPLFENISSQGKYLIKSMINKNPKNRITAEKALKSNWFITLETKKTLKVPNNEYKNILHNIETYKRTNRLQEVALSFLIHNIPDIDDIRNINKVYSNFNSTFDGKMSLKQLQEGFENYLNSKSLEKSEFDKKMKGIFDLLDTNKNEFIDYEEFCRGGIDKQLFTDKDVLEFAFGFIDKDGSESISLQELRAILSKEDNNKEVEQIIEELELGEENNGVLTFKKFEESMNNYLNKIEEN
jgi:serine/threonine protein kinase